MGTAAIFPTRVFNSTYTSVHDQSHLHFRPPQLKNANGAEQQCAWSISILTSNLYRLNFEVFQRSLKNYEMQLRLYKPYQHIGMYSLVVARLLKQQLCKRKAGWLSCICVACWCSFMVDSHFDFHFFVFALMFDCFAYLQVTFHEIAFNWDFLLLLDSFCCSLAFIFTICFVVWLFCLSTGHLSWNWDLSRLLFGWSK